MERNYSVEAIAWAATAIRHSKVVGEVQIEEVEGTHAGRTREVNCTPTPLHSSYPEFWSVDGGGASTRHFGA
jgi:hypothetical protein